MNETALKERLKTVAKERGIFFNEAWRQLLLERFLARLSRSAHQEKFIFKGGLLLAQYLNIGRETTDLDFLLRKLEGESATIEGAIRAISQIGLKDGFTYTWGGIELLTQPHMEYPGFRVSLNVSLGKMRDKIQIDIGVGDLVEEIEASFRPTEYKGEPIFDGEISLLTYPAEFIFAEKLETILSKGAFNSRMKDFHDVLLMTREPGLLDDPKIKKAVHATFKNRGTEFRHPIDFGSEGIKLLQKQWDLHLKSLRDMKDKLRLPSHVSEVITEMNQWLMRRWG
jgi:hypothetical protein